MDFARLRTFCKVAELESFTQAARRVHLTQAAVSQQIRALESELGVTLFERGARALALTNAGRKLHEYALRMLELHDDATREIARVATTLTGEVRLAASTIPAEHFLSPLLASFRQQCPQVTVTMLVAGSEATLAMIAANRADIGVAGLKPASPRLSFEPLVNDELVLVVQPTHRWARCKSVGLDELRREPFIAREIGSGTRSCLEQAGAALASFNLVMELASNEAVKEAVMQGAGVAVLSRRAVERDLNAGRLKAVAVAGLQPHRQFYLVTRKQPVLSPAAQKLAEFLRQSSSRRP